jgi:hypothetical protein
MSDLLMSASNGDSAALADISELVALPSVVPLGRRAFIAGVAGTAAAATLTSTVDAAVPSGASYYKAIEPRRLADTRPGKPNPTPRYQRLSANKIRVKVAGNGGIDSNAVAAAISVAVIGIGTGGWVRATPAGQDSRVANVVLDTPDSVVTNLATVKLSDGSVPGVPAGYVDITGSSPYNVVIDISGVYLPTNTAVNGGKRRDGRLQHLPKVLRLAAGTSVRNKGKLTIPIPTSTGIPSKATAVVVNLTAANASGSGYMTAYPSGLANVPLAVNVNFAPGETRGAGATVKLGKSGGVNAFDVYVVGGARVYADISGYITGEDSADTDEGLFVPIVPVRLLDTRLPAHIALAGGKSRLWPGWTRPFTIPSNKHGFPNAVGGVVPVSGVAMNVTSVSSMNAGYITVLPAQTIRRTVSNLNVSRAGQTVANHVISQVSTKGVECYSRSGADVVCDVAGWYVGSPRPIALSNPPVDPPPPQAPFNWFLTVPKMSLQNFVIPNAISGDPVVDSGNTWHWTNTGMIGDDRASIVVFGHRTSGDGPYRNQHLLESGDQLYIDTTDQRQYRYRFVGEQLTGDSSFAILNAARSNSAGTTFTLVACTGRGTPQNPGVLNDQPLGGIAWRIVSTFVLVEWKDTAPRLSG